MGWVSHNRGVVGTNEYIAPEQWMGDHQQYAPIFRRLQPPFLLYGVVSVIR